MNICTDHPPGVIIHPLGPVPERILHHLAITVQDRCGISCLVGDLMENPGYAQDPERDQYNCKPILQRLHRYCLPHSWRVLAVTEVDLFVPILKYVFGAAQIEGRCVLISLHRLRPQFYGHKEDEHLLLERVAKTALHELGHAVGLTHCRRRSCVMYSSTRIDDTDQKKADFCPTCRELFHWHLQKGM
jgi:archaemetzincin